MPCGVCAHVPKKRDQVDGMEIIDGEVDDQTDDLLPANFLRLEGTFDIPGVLLPTPVEDVWAMLGVDPRELFGDGPMPQAMIDWLLNLKNIIELIRDLIAGAENNKEA